MDIPITIGIVCNLVVIMFGLTYYLHLRKDPEASWYCGFSTMCGLIAISAVIMFPQYYGSIVYVRSIQGILIGIIAMGCIPLLIPSVRDEIRILRQR